MEALVEQTFDLNEYGFYMTMKDLVIEADKALLFAPEDFVIWGEMDLESRRKNNSTEKFV